MTEVADSGPLESASERPYDDDICRKFAFATLAWGLLGMLAGLVVAALMLAPTLFRGFPELTFGRLRPLHTHLALFAFIGNGLFAAVYYSTQRLCKVRMWSGLLSRLHFWDGKPSSSR